MEALIRNESWGLVVGKQQYAFVSFDDDAGIWKPPKDTTFRTRRLALDITLNVMVDLFSSSELDANGRDKDNVTPVVQIFSSGEQTPFVIELISTSSSGSWFVRSDGIQRTEAAQTLETI